MKELIKTGSCTLTLCERFSPKLYDRYDNKVDTSIILVSIKFIYPSKRFDEQLM